MSASAAAVSRPLKKTKMVSFRLSWEEYSLLQGACAKCGARSVSELVRSAMQQLILNAELLEQGSAEADLRELKLKFNVLSAKVERLSGLLRDNG